MLWDNEVIGGEKCIVQQWLCCKPVTRQAWDLSCLCSCASPSPPARSPRTACPGWCAGPGQRRDAPEPQWSQVLYICGRAPPNSLISLKPSSVAFSCACVAFERQGVAEACNVLVLILTILCFSEELQFLLQLMWVGIIKYPFRCPHYCS